MSNVSPKAVSMAVKLAANLLAKNKAEISALKKVVTAQDSRLKETATKDRAFKLATTLVVGEDTLREIQEKVASLMREDLDVVEKAMDLGLTQGLKLGSVIENKETDTVSTNALIDCLMALSNE